MDSLDHVEMIMLVEDEFGKCKVLCQNHVVVYHILMYWENRLHYISFVTLLATCFTVLGLEIPEAQLEHLDTPAKIAEYLHKSEINKSNP